MPASTKLCTELITYLRQKTNFSQLKTILNTTMKAKFVLSFLFTLLVSVISGNIVADVMSWNPFYTTGGIFALSLIPGIMPSGASAMGLLREMWTGELIKKFRHENQWLSKVPSRNDLVVNNVIHLVEIGADPEVLINNTTYPIPINLREDIDTPIGLDKFDTENTAITDDELQALPYDKPGSVLNQHAEVLEEKTASKAAHSLSPQTHSTASPIIPTGGASNGETVARKMLTPSDIKKAKKAMDKMGVPKKDRILVLCPDHVGDLLEVDEKFANQYKNIRTGEILMLYGFEIFESLDTPTYSEAAGVYTKKAFNAAADDANDHVSSFFFYAGRTMQFRGAVKMYQSLSSSDPENRRTVVGFRLYHMCVPIKAEACGVIVSATA